MPARTDRRISSRQARLLVSSTVLAAVTLAAGCTGIIAGSAAARPEAPQNVASRDADPAVASTSAPAPSTTAASTAAPATAAPTTTSPPTTAAPTTAAPTTTEPNPAIVPVGAPDAPYVAVWSGGGNETARIQQRLLDLGFWHSGVDGGYGLTTTQAVMAFQKYMGLDASGSVDQETADALTNARFRAHGLADAGTLVEIDQTKQLLFIVHDGRTVWVLNTSTGNGQEYSERNQNFPDELVNGVAITRNGLHDVYRQHSDGWREGDLGRIYRPKYFSGGQAIHGSNHIPNYPASHGCVRVSIPAMEFIWENNLIPIQTPVWVHGSI